MISGSMSKPPLIISITFPAASPSPVQSGSGAHIPSSLWDTANGRNLVVDPKAARGLSAVGRSFIPGVAHHLPALVALPAPSYTSYRGLQPSLWASATTAWGF